MQSIVLIDYGSGNLRSAEKALRRVASELGGAREVTATDDPQTIAKADAVVLPGVGAFAACVRALNGRPGVTEAMIEAVKGRGAPFLGVCVGMQLMADRGLEFGETPGLGWIGGDVKRITPNDPSLKVPHMGWNDLARRPHPIFAGLPEPAALYFTHSFAFYPSDDADLIAESDHGGRFPAAVARDNMAGVQFHPEKSQGQGLALLTNFLEWRP